MCGTNIKSPKGLSGDKRRSTERKSKLWRISRNKKTYICTNFLSILSGFFCACVFFKQFLVIWSLWLGHYLEKQRRSPFGSPKAKTRGPQAQRVLAAGLPRRTPFTSLHPWLFHITSLFDEPGLVKRDFFHCPQTQPVPKVYHTQCYVVEEIQTFVEFNPNILVRRFQRMSNYTYSADKFGQQKKLCAGMVNGSVQFC